MASGIVAGAGLDKDAVNYRQHEQCLSCTHFYHPNSCDIVQGNISPDNVCNKWEVKPKSDMGKDGAFYREEYERMNRT